MAPSFHEGGARNLQSLSEAPEPLRSVMARIAAGETLRFLLFQEESTGMGVRSPSSLLGLADQRWIRVSDDGDGSVYVEERIVDQEKAEKMPEEPPSPSLSED